MNRRIISLLGAILFVVSTLPMKVEAGEIFESQDEAYNAYLTLSSTLNISMDCISEEYPNDFGGCYLDGNTLVIQVTNDEQDTKDFYLAACNNSKYVRFEVVEYSYEELQDIQEKKVEELKNVYNIAEYYVDVPNNVINIGVLSNSTQFINGEGQGNSIKALYVNQNQYDALFSYFFSNGQNVFTQEKYEEWKGYGGEYAERAEAREELRRYLIDENGNYDADRIKELFIESKGANIKYDYKTRRSEEAELFISSQ